MTRTRIGNQYLKNEAKRKQLQSEVKEYLKSHSNLNDEEQYRFLECYLQENTIETTAFKLDKDIRDISFLYFGVATTLARNAFARYTYN